MNMKSVIFFIFTAIALSCYTSCSNTPAAMSVVPDAAPDPVSFEEYFSRRAKLIERSSEKVAYLLKSADNARPALYRQEANFFYFTGVCQPSCFLLVAPNGISVDGQTFKSVFFTRDNLLLQENSNIVSKGETVVNLSRLNEIMASVYPTLDTLYASFPEIPLRYTDWLNYENVDLLELSTEKLRKEYPRLVVRPFRSLGSMRQIKSDAEIALIRHAIDVTEEALRQIWRAITPGVTENELQGIMHYVFSKYDAREYAFYPIIGSGVNALEPHYQDNNSATRYGEMIKIDMGARFRGYCADITRSFPVSGRFTPEQREVYSVVLDIQKKVLEAVRPGATKGEINRLSDRLLTEAGYMKYRLHAITHHIGIEVHDFETDTIFRPGNVITIEPGVYIPADAVELPEGFRGMGIRIEDVVLVTETGHEVLSKRIPKEIDDIEAAMRKR